MWTLRVAMVGALLAGWSAQAASFRQITIADPGNPPIAANIWYPSAAPVKPEALGLLRQDVAVDGPIAGHGLGLIVISHGTGGNDSNHIDTARALADAGFVVVAPTHTGDNYRDMSRQLRIWDRPRQLHLVLDYMLRDWPDHARIDPRRIGAFGFSAGGFTVLVAAGGVPDMSRIPAHCHDHPQDWTCQMIAAHHQAGSAGPPAPVWVHDPRIRAAIVAAPALGYTFGKTGLTGVHIPIQLWRAENDHILPQPFYAQAVADDLPVKPDYHVVLGADHLDFLVPCTAALAKVAPMICMSPPGFDRVAFHAAFNRAVVGFFTARLK
jgi:predicted dienelactone hydrolase